MEAQRVLSLAHQQMNPIESYDKQQEQLAVEHLDSRPPNLMKLTSFIMFRLLLMLIAPLLAA